MRVVFLDDVENAGRAGEIKEVKDGYARNYLLPRKLAAAANAATVQQAEAKARAIAKEQEKLDDAARAVASKLSAAPLVMVARVGSEGRLFGSVTSADIAEELSKRGIITCAKHFPGLGGGTVDPHFYLPRIDRTKRQLLHEDAVPFLKLFNHAGMIMISHAHYPGLGDEKPVPASLSSRVVSGFLRKKLGYKGLTITDDLTMGAVTSVGLTPETFLRAFEAGNDLLLFSQTTPLVERAFKTMLRAVRESAVLRQRVDESVDRIVALKGRIEFVPLRYRTHLKTRITRQVEKLRKSVAEVRSRAVTV